jgi:excinuclease ABC subunit C
LKKRSGKALKSELADIDGIGPKTAETLLRHFKSLNGIKNAQLEDLEAVAGKDKAKKIQAYFAG